MKRVLALAPILVAFAAPAYGAGGGNASLYGGGDLMEAKLGPARARLNRSLGLLRSGFNEGRLCDPLSCGDGAVAQCRVLTTLSTEQRDACRAWLTGRTDDLLAVNRDDRTPLAVTRASLALPVAFGTRPVAAITKLGAEGQILFNEDSLRTASEAQIMALLGHELSHKLPITPGRFVTDEEAYGPFRRGRDFLDAVGAAIAVYAMRHSVPPQPPPGLPDGIDVAKACSLATDFRRRYVTGLYVDATGGLPTAEAVSLANVDNAALDAIAERPEARSFVRAVVGSREARAQAVRRLFQRYLLRPPSAEEARLMVERLSAGVPYEVVVSSILGDHEYGSLRGADAPAAWIAAVFHDLLNRAPTADERGRHLIDLQRRERATVAVTVLKNNAGAWGRWIGDWFDRWLNRPPRAEEAESYGRELRAGTGWESALAGLFSTPEYVALEALRWEVCASGRGPASVTTATARRRAR